MPIGTRRLVASLGDNTETEKVVSIVRRKVVAKGESAFTRRLIPASAAKGYLIHVVETDRIDVPIRLVRTKSITTPFSALPCMSCKPNAFGFLQTNRMGETLSSITPVQFEPRKV